MEKISVVVPCYNEEDVLELFNVAMEKLRKELKNVTLEVMGWIWCRVKASLARDFATFA